MQKKEKNILWFSEVDKDDGAYVGGKGANLGELTKAGIPVPNGFIVTSKAYFDFIKQNNLKDRIKQAIKSVDTNDPHSINVASQKIKKLIDDGKISPSLAKEIIHGYLKLGGLMRHALVAIRSSATAEDLPGASFAGQQATFLNIKGEANVVNHVKDCWASLFEPRAIFYREEKGFDHFKVGIAVPVQEMIPADISGVMFTIDPVNNQKNKIVIEAIYGLGEYIVQGIVTPDIYVVDKNDLDIASKNVEEQKIQLIKVGSTTKKESVPRKLRNRRKLTDKQIIELAKIGKKIHKHYFYPQDIEWVLYKNKFFIVQARPVTTIKEKDKDEKKQEKIKKPVLLKGTPASPGIASGPIKKILSAKEIGKVKSGDILVTSMTTPDFVPAMKRVAAIVTDKGGQTSHAAIVSRELGIPCVVGTETATQILKNEQIITVNGAQGEIYKGGLDIKQSPFAIPTTPSISNSTIQNLKKGEKIETATNVYVNLAEPSLAAAVAQRQVDGIGLLRAEFMMAQIGTHPKKVIKDKKQKEFIQKLAADIETFCQSFYPRPVVYRASDFKTNEYRNLTGGVAYEPEEENPLLGFRGAFRYIVDEAVFEMELKAIKQVRKKFNNLSLMIPFVRTPEQLKQVKKIVAANGLSRTSSFKLWLMVELPSNVILLEDFIKVGIDGVSIGSNDLTMLILGVDRDNSELIEVFDELNPAVLWALEKTIKTCSKEKITCSICGQAPSVYPDLVEKLISWGITSISVNPDAIERTREIVAQVEQKLSKK